MSKNLYESEILSEMATLCSKKEGFGIVVVMHSDDHEPQHVHLTYPVTYLKIIKI